MESTSLNEEESLCELEKASKQYCDLWFADGNNNLLKLLEDNDYFAVIVKISNGDAISNAFASAGAWKHFEILQAFIHHGMNVDAKDSDGNTALMYSSRKGYKEIVQLLLDHNADIDLKNFRNETAFDRASTEEIKEMIQNHVNTNYVLK